MHASLLLTLLAAATPSPGAGPGADARLAQAWQRLHPGHSPPAACPGADPVRELGADLGGTATVLASLRYGVIAIAPGGQPVAGLDLGCGPAGPSQVLGLATVRASGLAAPDLAVRTVQYGHCGKQGQWLLLHLQRDGQGAALRPLLAVDDDVERACGSAPREVYKAQIDVIAPGVVRVNVAGTSQAQLPSGDFAPPQPLQRSVTYTMGPAGQFVAGGQ